MTSFCASTPGQQVRVRIQLRVVLPVVTAVATRVQHNTEYSESGNHLLLYMPDRGAGNYRLL